MDHKSVDATAQQACVPNAQKDHVHQQAIQALRNKYDENQDRIRGLEDIERVRRERHWTRAFYSSITFGVALITAISYIVTSAFFELRPMHQLIARIATIAALTFGFFSIYNWDRSFMIDFKCRARSLVVENEIQEIRISGLATPGFRGPDANTIDKALHCIAEKIDELEKM